MNLAWQDLRQLEESYGDSFYLLDMNKFTANYNRFLSAFRAIYANTNIAYSYKTNYLPRLCKCVDELGGYAEVVSSMEYSLATRVGVAPARIIFNGPYKTRSDIEHAVISGAMVNLDSPYEAEILAQLAQAKPDRAFCVGIRCNLGAVDGSTSRFGFDVDTDLPRTLSTLRALPNCEIAGLHCHYCTSTKSPQTYQLIADKMLHLAKTHFAGAPPRFLDLGGGFFSKMDESLKQQFSCHVATIEEYAAAIATRFATAFRETPCPELILEPGLALTADVLRFCAKVIDTKTVGDRTVVLVSGSVYGIKPTLSGKNLPMSVVRRHEDVQNEHTCDVVGCTCMEHDVMYSGFRGNIEPGDYVVFDNVGAYTLVLSPSFIRPCAPVLCVDPESSKVEVAKRQERDDDVFATYVFDA